MAALVIETPSVNLAVPLERVKKFLRVEIPDDDDLITGLIDAATVSCETFTNRSFLIKGFRQSLDSFPYYTDTMLSQMAYPPSYWSLPRYSTTLWNYSQMIKLFRPPLFKVDRISFLASGDAQWHDMVPAPDLWKPGRVYLAATPPSVAADEVMDNFGNVQVCVSGGVSDSEPPTWNKTLNGVTVETNPDPSGEGAGPVQWRNDGPLPVVKQGGGFGGQFGKFIVDPDSEPARIFPGPPGQFWPPVLYVPNAVQIHFRAGYSVDDTGIPQIMKTAIMMTVAHWYENREPVLPGAAQKLPYHVEMLLWNWRVQDMAPTRG